MSRLCYTHPKFWYRAATTLKCVIMTPLGRPVVPEEYNSSATSSRGHISTHGTEITLCGPLAHRLANGVHPGTGTPIVTIS